MKTANLAASQRLRLCLYIAGDSPNTRRALANLRDICTCGAVEYDLTVVDVIREPRRALNDGVLVAPTLLKLGPGPARKIMGDLSDKQLVQAILKQPESAA